MNEVEQESPCLLNSEGDSSGISYPQNGHYSVVNVRYFTSKSSVSIRSLRSVYIRFAQYTFTLFSAIACASLRLRFSHASADFGLVRFVKSAFL